MQKSRQVRKVLIASHLGVARTIPLHMIPAAHNFRASPKYTLGSFGTSVRGRTDVIRRSSPGYLVVRRVLDTPRKNAMGNMVLQSPLGMQLQPDFNTQFLRSSGNGCIRRKMGYSTRIEVKVMDMRVGSTGEAIPTLVRLLL